MQQNVYFGNGWWESGDKFMPGEKANALALYVQANI